MSEPGIVAAILFQTVGFLAAAVAVYTKLVERIAVLEAKVDMLTIQLRAAWKLWNGEAR